ncbi:MAG: hypothetical protein DCC75_08315 [Proteobacteria bacterium]|nr:MAG: hypothetical protein DCC75_08315 [Pseudomonadota bacterium]
MAPPKTNFDITKIVLAVLVLGILITASFWVMQPFLPALVWAAMIVIATWPAMLLVQAKLRGSRTLAVTTMTLALTMVLVVPLTIAVWAIVENMGAVSQKVQEYTAQGVPAAPDWLKDVPIIGSRLVERWKQAAALGREEAMTSLAPYVGRAFTWLLQQIGGFGEVLLHFILTVILSAILYANGESSARGIVSFARALAQDRGEKAAILAAQAIRAVANGVIITALIQAIMTWLGLLVAGVPYAVILSSVTFLTCVIQIGAAPVLIGSIIWLFYYGSTFAAWAFLVWAIVIMVSDNLIRPFLIKRGANLPLILIFAGVIGGLIAFGIIGIFVGPVVLAISYTWMQSWIDGEESRANAA